MSSNYKIFLYFLSTLNDSLRVGLGLRGSANIYSQLNRTNAAPKKIAQPQQTSIQFREIPIQQQQTKTKSSLPNVSVNEILEDTHVVVEGLRQYMNYSAKYATKPIPKQIYTPLLPQIDKAAIDRQVEEIEKRYKVPQQLVSEFPDRNYHKVVPNQNVQLPHNQTLSQRSKERKVPANRASRVMSFGGLALSLGVGAVEEFTKRVVGMSSPNQNSSILGSSLLLSESNAKKIVDTLCRVRGAALKLGQIISIQDNQMISPELQAIFERVRQSADYMPESQMNQMMSSELGKDWKSLFKYFDMKPFAAASIGQVHYAKLHDDSQVAVKIQYPGVAESIESDIKNVLAILKYANVFPEGLFIDHIMAYAKKELSWEIDYHREARCSKQYRELILEHCDPSENFKVPIVYPDLTTKKVLTTELITGIPIDKLDNYIETSKQEVKNSIAERILRLFFRELFVFRYMQTDPNWSNFFYDYKTDCISLIDFGSTRSYPHEFVNQYLDIIKAAIDNDRELVLKKSEEIGFLSGYESEIFKKAHVDSVMIIGEAIRFPDKFDFGKQSVIEKIHHLIPTMLQYRLKPPPEEIYSLHRKLSGLFLLFTRLKAQINCREIFEQTTTNFKQ